MHIRWSKMLLLAAFLYWSSGVGGYLHERIEHWHPPDPAAQIERPAKNGEKPLQEADDHDECPTCQTLKAMKAHPPDAPQVPQPSLPSAQTIFPPPAPAPLLAFVVFIPARAPPLAAPASL